LQQHSALIILIPSIWHYFFKGTACVWRHRFPSQPIGDGDGFGGVTIVRTRGWLDDGDVEVNEALSTLLWQNIERKIGRREQLPGTRHRCRIVGYDTQEVTTHA
jgi:hypothetical protein